MAALMLLSCSASTRQLFFDMPPPSKEELARKEQEKAAREAAVAQQPQAADGMAVAESALPPPEIEKYLSWDKVQEELPAHALGGVDWSAALEQGLVRPRPGSDPKAADAAAFQYDFIIEGKNAKFDALFPHSAHTGWLGCRNCHTALYPKKRNPATMKEMRAGASCGSCHGNVAFSLKQCKRCHINM
jgi:c(7)-type cytochrome triheme protein